MAKALATSAGGSRQNWRRKRDETTSQRSPLVMALALVLYFLGGAPLVIYLAFLALSAIRVVVP